MAEYIEREAAYRAFSTNESLNGFEKAYCRGIIRNIPASNVAPVVHGRWVHKILLGEQAWFCSECKTIGSPQWKRCPVCEAKMDGGGDHA